MKKKNHRKNRIIFPAVLILFAVLIALAEGTRAKPYDDGVNVVCLDAGHGGSDSGAVSDDGKRLEKDDALALTLKIREKLEERGITVVLAREDDSDVSLKDRCRLANRMNCDLYIAVHRNSADNVSASGIEAWISSNPSRLESRFAEAVVENICAVTGQKNRGVKRGYRGNPVGNYYINSKTDMPSVLLEVGFITNGEDNRIFDEKLDVTAEAIADSVINTFFKQS